MESPVTLSASMGISFFLALGVTYAVQGVKWLCEVLPTTKTNNLPSWLWVGISLIISGAICWVLKVDAIATLFESADIGLSAPWTYLATGLAIGISSNVIYTATKPCERRLSGAARWFAYRLVWRSPSIPKLGTLLPKMGIVDRNTSNQQQMLVILSSRKSRLRRNL